MLTHQKQMGGGGDENLIEETQGYQQYWTDYLGETKETALRIWFSVSERIMTITRPK
jgi:hypothetical protein